MFNAMKNKHIAHFPRFQHFAVFLLAAIIAMPFFFASPASAHPFDQTYESAVEALDAYRALVKDYPDDLDLHYLLGTMLIMANQLDEAAEQFQFVLKRKKDYDMAWYKMAEVLYRKKEFAKAIPQLEKMKDKSLQDDKLIAESTVYLQLKNPKKALDAAKKATTLDKLNPGGWLYIGLAERDLGHFDKAITNVLKSLKMDPGQPLVYDWFRELISKHEPVKKQIAHLTELYKAIPYDSETARRINMDIYHLKSHGSMK